jgi:hypothetical protein
MTFDLSFTEEESVVVRAALVKYASRHAALSSNPYGEELYRRNQARAAKIAQEIIARIDHVEL